MHLILAIRPAASAPYRIVGDEGSRIQGYHASPRDAETAILTFCRAHRCTASVRVYTPRNALWSLTEIAADGTVQSVRPKWLAKQREAA